MVKMKISNETYHHALALYMLARRKQAEVDAMEAKMNALLCDDNGSHASDAIYTYGNIGSQEEFDTAIKKMGVEVEAG